MCTAYCTKDCFSLFQCLIENYIFRIEFNIAFTLLESPNLQRLVGYSSASNVIVNIFIIYLLSLTSIKL